MSDSAKKMFNKGAAEAMPNTEFSSGIFETAQSTGGSSAAAGKTQGVSLAGDNIDERRLAGSGTISKGPEGAGETPGQGSGSLVDRVNTDGSIDKVKNTAGINNV
ncbi:hypothetical protein GGS20DRAFT_588417 [Poronia punctata]|nr:hypothetical protein GGS20DRAFT_588417 [Poronia punctata]